MAHASAIRRTQSRIWCTQYSYSVRRFRLISQQPFVAYVRAKHRRKVLDGCYLYGRSSSRLVFTRKSHNFSQKTSRIAASGWCRQCLQRGCCVQTCTLSQTANEAVQPPTSAWNRFDTSLKHVYTLQPVAQPAGGNVLNVQINKLTNKQSFVIDLILVITRDHMLPTLKINKNSFLNFENFDQTCQVVYCPHSRLAARRSTWWRHKRLRMQDRSSAAWLRSFA